MSQSQIALEQQLLSSYVANRSYRPRTAACKKSTCKTKRFVSLAQFLGPGLSPKGIAWENRLRRDALAETLKRVAGTK